MHEKDLKISILNDYYGTLLKKNQAEIVDLYYNQDLSLAEISEELNISRQGVHDSLKRAEKILVEYENKLKLCERLNKYNNIAEKIRQYAENINSENYIDNADKIKAEANKILNEG